MVITTSREPGNRTRSFVNELVTILPVLVKVNRGKATLLDLYDISISKKARWLVIVYEKKGNPSMFKIFKPSIPRSELYEKYRVLLRGVTLYREKARSKPSRYNGDYCISFGGNGDVYALAGIISEVTGYKFCRVSVDSDVRRIRISTVNDVKTVSFHDEKRDVVGPIIRVRRIEVVGDDNS